MPLVVATFVTTVALTGGHALAETLEPVTIPAAGVSLNVPASWDSFGVSGQHFDPAPRKCAQSAVDAYEPFVSQGLQVVAIPRPCSMHSIGSLTVFVADAPGATLARIGRRLRAQYKNIEAQAVSSEPITVGDVPALKTIGRAGKGKNAVRIGQLDMLRDGRLVTVSISVPKASAAVADQVISSVTTLPFPSP